MVTCYSTSLWGVVTCIPAYTELPKEQQKHFIESIRLYPVCLLKLGDTFMRKELIISIQRAITMYVANKEGTYYRGNYNYDLQYINNSQYIPDHRKQNIREIDDICNQSNRNSSSQLELARSIYNYLKNIKTGWLLFWFIQVGHSSIMRDGIHQAIFVYDPKLFADCKLPAAPSATMENQINNDEHQVRITITETPIPETENLTAQYSRIIQTNSELAQRLEATEKKLTEEKIKNAALSDSLSKQNFCNDALKRKLTVILQANGHSNASRSEIQMASTPKKMAQRNESNNIVGGNMSYRL